MSCRLRCCPEVFHDLSEEEFAELQELMLPVRYEKGDLIFQEGEFASGIYIICQGMVRVGKYYQGKRLTLKLLKAGELLGMEALVSERPVIRPNYAQAVEPTEVAFLEKKAFLEFCQEHPAIISSLCRKALEEITILQRKLVQSVLAPADERVAAILLELGEICGEETGSGLFIGSCFSRTELAEFVGVSPETLIRGLSRLKDEGLIELHDKGIIIRDRARLERLKGARSKSLSASPSISKVSSTSIPIG